MRKEIYQGLRDVVFFPLAFFCLLFLDNCQHYKPSFAPPPLKVERLEGYASLNLRGEKGQAKSRFSFLFLLPDLGRIEVFDLLGRTSYSLLIKEEEAFFVLPSKKVYWQAKREEIIDKFLGFSLSPKEMGCLLSGQWEGSDIGWNLERDDKGRITKGRRENLYFEVREFFVRTSVPRLILFEHSLDQGRMKIFSINFDQPQREDVFSLSFLNNFTPKSWEEIQRILDNES